MAFADYHEVKQKIKLYMVYVPAGSLAIYVFLLFPELDGLPLLPPPVLTVKVPDSWKYVAASPKAARIKMTLGVGQIDIRWYRTII